MERVDTNTAKLHHRTDTHQDLHVEFRGVGNTCEKVLEVHGLSKYYTIALYKKGKATLKWHQ